MNSLNQIMVQLIYIQQMRLIKKLFQSSQSEKVQKKQKVSLLSWLCGSKSVQQKQVIDYSLLVVPQSQTKRSQLSSTIQPLSKSLYQPSIQSDLKSLILTITQLCIDKIQDLIVKDQIYALVNMDHILGQDDYAVWFIIARDQEINSLVHIRPYFFQKVFMRYDHLAHYNLLDVIHSKQNVCLRLDDSTYLQPFIDQYQKELINYFGFKLMADCFNKLKITIYKTKRHQIWLSFNQQIQSDALIEQILRQLGFNQSQQQFQSLKGEIPKGLTLQQYIDIMQHKQKLQSKYSGQSVAQYIKTKLIQKLSLSRKVTSPRAQSPREQKASQSHPTQQYYQQYILSMTANTQSKQTIQQFNIKLGQEEDQEEEIFQFNVYKDQREQEAKRVAINKERKKRSKSQDINLNQLSQPQDQNDYFDHKD